MYPQVLRNNAARKFEPSCRIHRNCLPFRRLNGEDHYTQQFNLCMDAFQKGEAFLVESTLETPVLAERLRADFVNLDKMLVVECQVTESKESIDRKRGIWNKHGLEMMTYEEWKKEN